MVKTRERSKSLPPWVQLAHKLVDLQIPLYVNIWRSIRRGGPTCLCSATLIVYSSIILTDEQSGTTHYCAYSLDNIFRFSVGSLPVKRCPAACSMAKYDELVSMCRMVIGTE
jgi:hypothetical protein